MEKTPQITPRMWEANRKDIEFLIFSGVGFDVEFYIGDGERYAGTPGTVYQIMPSMLQDREGFWDWYVDNCPQWFPTPLAAGKAFIKGFHKYNREVRQRSYGAT